MMSTLTLLQDAVEQQLSARNNDLLYQGKPIGVLCTGILSEMASIYRQSINHKIVARDINQCYIFLTNMLDTLLLHAPGHAYFQPIDTMLCRFEHRYGHYIQAGTIIPLHRQEQLQKEVAIRLPLITDKLLHKKIEPAYIDELNYAMDSLFNNSKMPYPGYVHQTYLPKLMDALESMADDSRAKAWSDRFVQLLVNFNFNYPGFFNRWSEKLIEVLKQQGELPEQREYLTKVEHQLKFSSCNSDICFDYSRESLLDQMQEYISKTFDQIEDGNLEPVLPKETSLLTKLNGDELNLIFYYFYKFRIYDYPNKREAAKAFSNTIQSISKQNISYKTLEKFEKSRLEASAIKMKRLLKAVVEAIDQDFKH